jgi:hypothetical protein
MSNTRKDQQRKDEDITPTISTNTKTTASSSSSQVQQQQAVNKALDETKDNIRRATDEARKDRTNHSSNYRNS